MNSIERAIKELESHIYLDDFADKKSYNLAIEALKKQIPKKPKLSEYDYSCPNCEFEYLINEKYCSNCGQKLDWSEEI